MAFALENVQLHAKEIGMSYYYVPDNPRAKLMYYLNCVCYTLELDSSDTRNIARLRNHQNYLSLTEEEKSELLVLCAMLSPDVLLNKVFFQNDQMCGDSTIKFYDIVTVSNQLVVSSSIAIGGQTKNISKIMTFKMSWLRENYLEPIQTLAHELEEAAESRRRRAIAAGQSDDDCIIL